MSFHIVILKRGFGVWRIYLKRFVVIFVVIGMPLVAGCGIDRIVASLSLEPQKTTKPLTMREAEDLYEKFYKIVIETGQVRDVSGGPPALRHQIGRASCRERG